MRLVFSEVFTNVGRGVLRKKVLFCRVPIPGNIAVVLLTLGTLAIDVIQTIALMNINKKDVKGFYMNKLKRRKYEDKYLTTSKFQKSF